MPDAPPVPQTLIDSPALVRPGEAVDLSTRPTNAADAAVKKEEARSRTAANLKRITELQELLYADGRYAVLVAIQAIDAGGKDSTIRRVFGHLNPQGVRVTSFKVPSDLEKRHDYLWRYHAACPPRGMVGIFNRSHYESVLVERVKGIAPEPTWRRRYDQINAFEAMLVSEGTLVLKFFLHLSKGEQAARFRDRLNDPEKWWKFSPSDIEERGRWGDYQAAFAEAIERCSTEVAPWYCIPADQKWYRDFLVSEVTRKAMENLSLRHPSPAPELEGQVKAFLAALETEG